MLTSLMINDVTCHCLSQQGWWHDVILSWACQVLLQFHVCLYVCLSDCMLLCPFVCLPVCYVSFYYSHTRTARTHIQLRYVSHHSVAAHNFTHTSVITTVIHSPYIAHTQVSHSVYTAHTQVSHSPYTAHTKAIRNPYTARTQPVLRPHTHTHTHRGYTHLIHNPYTGHKPYSNQPLIP